MLAREQKSELLSRKVVALLRHDKGAAGALAMDLSGWVELHALCAHVKATEEEVREAFASSTRVAYQEMDGKTHIRAVYKASLARLDVPSEQAEAVCARVSQKLLDEAQRDDRREQRRREAEELDRRRRAKGAPWHRRRHAPVQCPQCGCTPPLAAHATPGAGSRAAARLWCSAGWRTAAVAHAP